MTRSKHLFNRLLNDLKAEESTGVNQSDAEARCDRSERRRLPMLASSESRMKFTPAGPTSSLRVVHALKLYCSRSGGVKSEPMARRCLDAGEKDLLHQPSGNGQRMGRADRRRLRASGSRSDPPRGFPPGTSFIHSIRQASAGSHCTIAVLSPAYFKSDYCEAELNAALAGTPNGKREGFARARRAL